jgi:Uma2 family endonuclease
MSTATITIGPEHHGQAMSLEEFADAEGREGHRYELSRGIVTVVDIPHEPHFDLVHAISEQLWNYRLSHPKEIHRILGGSDAKIMVAEFQSERHPDLLIYKTRRPKGVKGRKVWTVWIPELVIEVVSPDSADRDYHQKPDEYLQVGVQEYWIVDEPERLMTVHRRSGDEWTLTTVSPGKPYTTDLLPEWKFDLQRVFDAAEE